MVSRIDRTSPIPVYVQIAEQLRVLVMKAEQQGREKFYTDEELVKRFNVSRLTIRQAVQILVDENRLVRIKGSGTFLSKNKKMVASLESLDSFYNSFSSDRNLKAVILFKGVIPCPSDIANKLMLKPWSDVFYLKRIRFVDDIPVVIDNRYMNIEYGNRLSEDDLQNFSLAQLFPKKFNVRFSESEIEIEAMVADQEISELLNVDIGSPILYRYADMKGADGQCLIVGNSLFRGDMYKYKSVLKEDKF